MKKMYLFALASLMSLMTFGQTTETEPNNSFATANNTSNNYKDSVFASLGGGDIIDYFKPSMPWIGYGYNNGDYTVVLTVTNNGATSADFNFKLYNHSEAVVYDENVSATEVPAGGTVSKQFQICGQHLDSVYVVFSSSGSFDYKFYSYNTSVVKDIEPNDTRSQATMFNNDVEVSSGIQFTQALGGTETDEVDYHKTLLGPGDYEDLSLIIDARNYSCTDGQWIHYDCFKNDETTPFASGYVGDNNAVQLYIPAKSNISLSDLQAGDYLTFKVTASAAFGYNFHIGFAAISGAYGDDNNEEPNDDYTNAMTLPENTIKFGDVGYAEYNEEYEDWDVQDEFDTYKITLTQSGDLTFYMSAIPHNCEINDERLSVYFDVMDSVGNVTKWENLVMQTDNPQCYGDTLSSALKILSWKAGTYYIRVYSSYDYFLDYGAEINYALFYKQTASNSPDPEPNDEIEDAVPTVPDTTYNGHVGPYEVDPTDTYQFVMPYAGAVSFNIQATNDTCGGKSLLKYFVFDKEGNDVNYGDIIFEWDENAPCDSLQTGQIKIRGLEKDTFYLQLSSDDIQMQKTGNPKATMTRGTITLTFPVTYNFSYQFVDEAYVDVEPNNDKDHAIPVAPNEVKKGHTGFYTSGYGNNDNIDFYSLNLSNPGNVDLIIKTTYRSNYDLYNSSNYSKAFSIQGENTSFLNAKTPGYPQVEIVHPDSSYLDTIHICGVGAGPFLIKLQGIGEYEFHFEMKDEISGINEIEPNATKSQAQIFGDSSLIKGTISYFENNTYDVLDNYKIPVYDNDPITIYVKATNTQCAVKQGYYTSIGFNGYNSAGSNVVAKNIANNLNVAPGETIYDTITFSMQAPDTLFLEWSTYNTNLFEYEFFTSAFKPNSQFVITGDTTVCLGTQQYVAGNINQKNLTYHWSLPEGGGTITWVDSIATITWNQAGSFPIELYLSNSKGTSVTKTQDVIVNDAQPPSAPDIFNFARHLSTSPLPPGNTVQWFRNGTEIAGATDSVYYAALAGNYTARFINDCGLGPISNPYNFAADAGMQTIVFPGNADLPMAPQLRIKLAATSSSALPVFYSVISGPGTISNDSLRINGAGEIVVRAEQPGNDDFGPAEQKYDTIIVTKGSQVITTKAIPNQLLRNGYVHPGATSSAGLWVSYTISSGNASGGDSVRLTGIGTITIQAEQKGNANYNAASPVQQTFCVGIDTLAAIKGAATSCLGTYTYTAQKVAGANYVWILSEGGTIVTHNDTAFVTWTAVGTHTLKVKANSNCYAAYSFEPVISVTVGNVIPTTVTNMLPVDGAKGQGLPLVLSWVPGQYTESYDLYVWDSTSTRPATPYKKDLTGISFTIPQNAFPYNAPYKWQLISKNPCNQSPGPVQSFRLVPLPDLIVTSVLAPTSAISGQTISISWTVKNDGPGASLATENWQDNVYLSFDSTFNLYVTPQVRAGVWSQLDFPVKPLLITSKTNLAALQPGEQYTNTINFTLPITYNFPVYVFVQTDRNKTILEEAYDNNLDSAVKPMVISLAPAPDLRVDSVFAPNTVFSGAEISVTYKVKNYGSLTPAGSVWEDEIYLSQSQLFDSATAIKLHAIVNNRIYATSWQLEYKTYYPNAQQSRAYPGIQLQEDSGYVNSIAAVIPNFIFGQWYIHVKTNSDHRLYEGPSFSNNTNSVPVQVYLTPTPHLTVNSVTLPVSEASTTQPIGLNWVIKNIGSTDNIEKNQGHYKIFPTGALCPCGDNVPIRYMGRGESHAEICVGPPEYRDSVAEGSSYWLDRIYISSDPTGLNIENARLLQEYKNGSKQFAGIDFSPNGTNYILSASCGAKGIFNTDHALLPNRSFANSVGFVIPQDLAPGTYYLYVYTNPTKTVFEYPGTAEIKRSAPIVIERPDVVAAMNAPANAVAGTPVQVDYVISNNGPGSVYNYLRVDQVYVSTNPVFDGTAKLFATKTYTENVLTGTPVTHSVSYTLHPSQSGTRYFYVKTNTTQSFAETNTNNNLSAAGAVVFAAAAPIDLVVSQVAVPDTVYAGSGYASLEYTITNNGSGAGTGFATDSFFVSCSPVFSKTTAFFIGKKQRNRDIAPAASVKDTFSTRLPFTFEMGSCFPNNEFNNAYFFVKTNATDSIYEGPNSTNNTTASSLKVIKNLLVDFTVYNVSGPTTASVGRPYTLQWQIQNIGENSDRYFYVLDSVYLSLDSVFNSNIIPFGNLLWDNVSIGNKVIDRYLTKNFINVSPDDYYVFVKTNAGKKPYDGEKNFSNNMNLLRDVNGKAQTISVSRPPLSDLVDSLISYPPTASPGQPITVIHRIKNIGAGDTYPGKFMIQLSLSDDPQNKRELYSLSYKEKSVVIPPGGYIDDTIIVYLPRTVIPRNYSLWVNADHSNEVIESNELNNYTSAFINVFIPDPVDFTITSLEAVDTVLLGYSINSVRYIIKNNSANPANGFTSDGFYLSKSNVFDSSAILIGIKEKNISMEPLALDTLGFYPIVSGVTEGSYNLFLNTDLTNTIPETNETNNTAMTATPVYVKVKELQLGELETNTLGGDYRYYKLIIPDSLDGATISVKLVSEDSLTKVNQMFIGKGYVPDAAHFDYTYPTANYGNQDVIMAYTIAGNYYISFRCINPGYSTPQNITLKARKLPFEISSIQSATGGNIGNVTVKIIGSLFTEGMTAKLNKSGTEITASRVYFTNTTTVYATFNLQGNPLGIYDLTLSKGDTSFAVLNNGFSVVKADNGGLITGSGPNTGAGDGTEPGCDPGAASGLNSQLVTELIVPEKVFAGWPFVIQINFKNPTNYDIPAQVRTLYAEEIIKLGLTAESTFEGPHSIAIEITEADGPPGVIRAGGSGTIFIYGRSNDDAKGHTFTLVNLK